MRRRLLELAVILAVVPAACALALVLVDPTLAGNWIGNTYEGSSLNEHAIGNGEPNIFNMRGGIDEAEGLGGKDRLNGGRGRDVLRGGPGYDVLAACGQADRCGGEPGHDFMIAGADGAQINAGQYPAVRQYIDCGPGFELVYRDRRDVPADVSGYTVKILGSWSRCDRVIRVGNAKEAVD